MVITQTIKNFVKWRLYWSGRQLLSWSRLQESGADEPVRAPAGTETLRLSYPLAHAYLETYGTLNVVDIGARSGCGANWWHLPPLTRVLGFEPDPVECAKLNAQAQGQDRYFPLALWRDTSEQTLFVTREQACSSLFPPDPTTLEKFPEALGPLIRVTREQQVPVVPLDTWWVGEGKPQVSFLKIDTQGAEKAILEGATHTLESCVGLEVEVEFNPIYQGQPLFSEVDSLLREKGFALWALHEQVSYQRPPLVGLHRNRARVPAGGPAHRGQLHWANAVYFRDWARTPLAPKSAFQLSALLEVAGDHSAAVACAQKHSLTF